MKTTPDTSSTYAELQTFFKRNLERDGIACVFDLDGTLMGHNLLDDKEGQLQKLNEVLTYAKEICPKYTLPTIATNKTYAELAKLEELGINLSGVILCTENGGEIRVPIENPIDNIDFSIEERSECGRYYVLRARTKIEQLVAHTKETLNEFKSEIEAILGKFEVYAATEAVDENVKEITVEDYGRLLGLEPGPAKLSATRGTNTTIFIKTDSGFLNLKDSFSKLKADSNLWARITNSFSQLDIDLRFSSKALSVSKKEHIIIYNISDNIKAPQNLSLGKGAAIDLQRYIEPDVAILGAGDAGNDSPMVEALSENDFCIQMPNGEQEFDKILSASLISSGVRHFQQPTPAPDGVLGILRDNLRINS